MKLPFALRRPWLLLRGVRTDRNRPNLVHLASIDDPTEFVWSILPHAARTFAPSILLLRAPHARTAAVAYLYCRMLDTYEDLSHPGDREAALEAFAARMTTLEPPPPLSTTHVRDDRDRAHLLLVERHRLVDQVFAKLSDTEQKQIVGLVQDMAAGMAWSARRFADQGGVLVNADQLSRYCHHVIGGPILFTLSLVVDSDLTAEQRRDALAASELIQLANITRDVERDLARGIGYHPTLLPHLRRTEVAEPVRHARRQFMAHALPHGFAYVRLSRQLAPKRFDLARASAMLMLLYTDRHYQRCARQVGHRGWRSPERTGTIVAASLLAAVSRRWSERMMSRVERRFSNAAESMSPRSAER